MLAKSGQAEEIETRYSLKQAVLYTILGCAAIVIGGNYMVDSATHITVYLEVSQKIIALTIAALGTSLPELVISIMVARKEKQDLAIGNVTGSNIFSICFVAGMLFFFSYSNKQISK